jgi:ribosomal protein S1
VKSFNEKISWDKLKKSLKVGEQITGTVIRHEQYGVFVDIGYEFDGLIQITDFRDEATMTQEEYPVIGSKINVIVLGFKDFGCQIWLGVKQVNL